MASPTPRTRDGETAPWDALLCPTGRHMRVSQSLRTFPVGRASGRGRGSEKVAAARRRNAALMQLGPTLVHRAASATEELLPGVIRGKSFPTDPGTKRFACVGGAASRGRVFTAPPDAIVGFSKPTETLCSPVPRPHASPAVWVAVAAAVAVTLLVAVWAAAGGGCADDPSTYAVRCVSP
jgi:hypothetical protein